MMNEQAPWLPVRTGVVDPAPAGSKCRVEALAWLAPGPGEMLGDSRRSGSTGAPAIDALGVLGWFRGAESIPQVKLQTIKAA